MVDTVSVGDDDDYYFYCYLEEMNWKGGGELFLIEIWFCLHAEGKPGTKKWLSVKQMKWAKFGGGGGGMGSEHREGELAGQPSIHFYSLSPSQTLLTCPSSQVRPRDSVLAVKMPCGIVGQLLWSGCALCSLPFCQLNAEAWPREKGSHIPAGSWVSSCRWAAVWAETHLNSFAAFIDVLVCVLLPCRLL